MSSRKYEGVEAKNQGPTFVSLKVDMVMLRNDFVRLADVEPPTDASFKKVLTATHQTLGRLLERIR